METFFIIYLYPALLIGVMLSSILIGIRYPQARWWDTLLRCGAVVLCFFPLQIALMLGSKFGWQLPPYDLLGELCIDTGIMALVYCLPELLIGLGAACRFLVLAVMRLMGIRITPPAEGSNLGIHQHWLLPKPRELILSAKEQARRHTEMMLRGLSFALWSMLGLWALFHYFPVETEAGFHAWSTAVWYLRAACFGAFLLLPELVRSVASCCRR